MAEKLNAIEHTEKITNSNENNPLIKLIGSRVVRGPNWKWGKQDGKLFYSLI